jgi:hypothetical protein
MVINIIFWINICNLCQYHLKNFPLYIQVDPLTSINKHHDAPTPYMPFTSKINVHILMLTGMLACQPSRVNLRAYNRVLDF